jgi:hypothetical protein
MEEILLLLLLEEGENEGSSCWRRMSMGSRWRRSSFAFFWSRRNGRMSS